MVKGYKLTESAVRRTAETVRRVLGHGPQPVNQRLRGGGYSDIVYGFRFRNDSGETIPANAVLRIDDSEVEITDAIPPSEESPGRPEVRTFTLVALKPNTYGSQYSHFINSDSEVEADDYGTCYRGEYLGPFAGGYVKALYDDSDGVPAFGESWGPRNSSWKLRADTGGFRVIGDVDEDDHTVVVQCVPMLSLIGKADAGITQGTTGTISAWHGITAGSESDTGADITAYLRLTFGAVTSGGWVRCTYNLDSSAWEITQYGC